MENTLKKDDNGSHGAGVVGASPCRPAQLVLQGVRQ